MNRRDVLSKAADECMKELYSYAKPSVEWDTFIYENQMYSIKYQEWEKYKSLKNKKDLTKKENSELCMYPSDWGNKSIEECIGPRPYEFYYIPKDIMKDICDSYIHAYKIDEQQNLLDIIEILKNYCNDPIIDKYMEGKNGFPGYRGYEHPNNLQTELQKIIVKENPESNEQELASDCVSMFFKFLDMAGNFYSWNSELNAFNTYVYLGCSPSSNKETVIKNWKKYRNKDIEIDDEQIKKDYYGEDELD